MALFGLSCLTVKRTVTHIRVLLISTPRDHQNISSTNADEDSTTLAITEDDSQDTDNSHLKKTFKVHTNFMFSPLLSSLLFILCNLLFSLLFHPVILILFLHRRLPEAAFFARTYLSSQISKWETGKPTDCHIHIHTQHVHITIPIKYTS